MNFLKLPCAAASAARSQFSSTSRRCGWALATAAGTSILRPTLRARLGERLDHQDDLLVVGAGLEHVALAGAPRRAAARRGRGSCRPTRAARRTRRARARRHGERRRRTLGGSAGLVHAGSVTRSTGPRGRQSGGAAAGRQRRERRARRPARRASSSGRGPRRAPRRRPRPRRGTRDRWSGPSVPTTR